MECLGALRIRSIGLISDFINASGTHRLTVGGCSLGILVLPVHVVLVGAWTSAVKMKWNLAWVFAEMRRAAFVSIPLVNRIVCLQFTSPENEGQCQEDH